MFKNFIFSLIILAYCGSIFGSFAEDHDDFLKSWIPELNPENSKIPYIVYGQYCKQEEAVYISRPNSEFFKKDNLPTFEEGDLVFGDVSNENEKRSNQNIDEYALTEIKVNELSILNTQIAVTEESLLLMIPRNPSLITVEKIIDSVVFYFGEEDLNGTHIHVFLLGQTSSEISHYVSQNLNNLYLENSRNPLTKILENSVTTGIIPREYTIGNYNKDDFEFSSERAAFEKIMIDYARMMLHLEVKYKIRMSFSFQLNNTLKKGLNFKLLKEEIQSLALGNQSPTKKIRQDMQNLNVSQKNTYKPRSITF